MLCEELKKYEHGELEGMTENQLEMETIKIFDYACFHIEQNIPKTSHKVISNVPPKSLQTRKLEICVNNMNTKISQLTVRPNDVQIARKRNLYSN